MSYIETYPVQHSTIIRLFSDSEEIQMNPHYQRMGGVWTLDKKQLLIDSIINDYDIPKIYLHSFSREEKKESGYAYAVIDGRQRLEAIWQFIEGRFKLADDFIYQDDENIKLSNMTYFDISNVYPRVKIKFDSFVLPVIGVKTDDLELIEDMFSRLNEAAPLNAAEKRNSIGGNMVAAIRDVAENDFFTSKVKFSNKRFQHREVAARILLIEENLDKQGRLFDTKKEFLDAMAKNYKSAEKNRVLMLKDVAISVLDHMNSIFIDNDFLLRSQGNIALYYLLAKSAINNEEITKFDRSALYNFLENVKENREIAENNYIEASFELLEYDRLTQQGTNDSSNIRERLRILSEYLDIKSIHV